MPSASDPTYQTALALMTEGRGLRQAPDSGVSGLWRPSLRGMVDSRVSTPETYFDFYLNVVPDPDEAYRLNPDFPRIVRQHPAVQAAMRKRCTTVASFPDRWEPNPDAKDQHAAKEVARYVEWAWRQLPDLPKLYYLLQYHGVLEGGIGVEFVWHREATGVVRPSKWYPVHKSRVVFDRMGNRAMLCRSAPVWGAYVSLDPRNLPAGPVPPGETAVPESLYPPGKWLYHQYLTAPGAWYEPGLEGYQYYGLGEDVALYYPVTFEVFGAKLRMKFIEKYGIPPMRMWYASASQFRDDWRKVATSARGESLAVFPGVAGSEQTLKSNYHLEDVEPPKASFDMFQNLSDHCGRLIDAILLGSADENQRGEHGGYSDHVSRQESGPQIVYRFDARNISGTIGRELAGPIARGRFPNLPNEYVPVHKLEPKEEKDQAAQLDNIEKASKFISVPKDFVYDAAGIPRPQNGEETIGGEQAQPMPGMPGMGGPGGMPPPQGQPPKGPQQQPPGRPGMPQPQRQGPNRGPGQRRGGVGHQGGAGAVAGREGHR